MWCWERWGDPRLKQPLATPLRYRSLSFVALQVSAFRARGWRAPLSKKRQPFQPAPAFNRGDQCESREVSYIEVVLVDFVPHSRSKPSVFPKLSNEFRMDSYPGFQAPNIPFQPSLCYLPSALCQPRWTITSPGARCGGMPSASGTPVPVPSPRPVHASFRIIIPALLRTPQKSLQTASPQTETRSEAWAPLLI